MDNGQLVLKAIKEQYTGTTEGCNGQGCTNTKDFTSGNVITGHIPTGSWLRGRFEVRAKLPNGRHLWPAIWMLPTESTYGGWAASGEIDIMEGKGQFPRSISGTLHHGAAWPNNMWTSSGDVDFLTDFSEEFHTFALEWETDSMKWFVDDINFYTLNTSRWWNNSPQNNPYSAPGQPWDQKFHLLLNLAVGGNFFDGLPPLTDQDVSNWVSSELRIDFVRVFAKGGCVTSQPSSASTIPTDLPPVEDQDNQNEASNGWVLEFGPAVYGGAAAGGVLLLMIIVGVVVAVLVVKRRNAKYTLPHVLSPPDVKLKPFPSS